MRAGARAFGLLLGAALAATSTGRGVAERAAEVVATIEVNSSADSPGICPSSVECTLRAAIEAANLSEADVVRIAFSPASFPISAPTTIRLQEAPLPPVSRPDVRIDAGGLPVVLDGSDLLASPAVDGLVLQGPRAALAGLTVIGFSGACIVLAGEGSRAGGTTREEANSAGSCQTGLAVRASAATAIGNQIGFDRAGSAAGVTVGIFVEAPEATIGTLSPGSGNVVGNAVTGIRAGSATAITGIRIRGNTIGMAPPGSPAPITTGIEIDAGVTGAHVEANVIASAGGAGILVKPDAASLRARANRLERNRFQDVSGLAVDLDADGVRNPNDADDSDTGANGLQNHPVISRATRAQVLGRVPACGTCSVELYLASHAPGGALDNGSIPVPAAIAMTDSAGSFSFDGLQLPPGAWVTALATDPEGNTSEFGPSAHVGEGSAACGDLTLLPGWNHVGYFGPPMTLGNSFPEGDSAAVSAIYALVNGSEGYLRWFSSTAVGRTLDSLVPGSAYWFYTDRVTTLSNRFTVSSPVRVQLKAGWNDFVYLGGTADTGDALASLAGAYADVYRFDAGTGRWSWSGRSETPAWARGFRDIEACVTYQIRLSTDAVLAPLPP